MTTQAFYSLLNIRSTILLELFIHIQIGKPNPFYAQSISNLEKLENIHLQFAYNLAKLISSQNNFSSNLEQMDKGAPYFYLKDTLETTVTCSFNTNNCKQVHLATSPTCTYTLLNWVKFVFCEMVAKTIYNFPVELWRQIVMYVWKYRWPYNTDLELEVEKILTLQLVYNYTALEVAEGLMGKFLSNCTLNSMHCYDIGIQALRTKIYTLAIAWLELANEKAVLDSKSSISYIRFTLRVAIERHNLYFDGRPKNNWDYAHFSRKLRHYVPKDYKRAQILRNIPKKTFEGSREKPYERLSYLKLCSGETLQSEQNPASLFCWYECKLHVTLAIGPAKMELLARDPYIVQIYDFLNPIETKTFLSDVEGNMDLNKNFFKTEPCKTQQSLSETLSSKVVNLSATVKGKIGAFDRQLKINKNLKAFFNVEIFSVGQHYFPRVQQMPAVSADSLECPMATILMHLNDIKHGGATIFPYAGITAPPSLGSAIIWFNRLQDGSPDNATIHGACPVTTGEKWVAKRWITMRDSCSLRQHERYQFPVNGKYVKRQRRINRLQPQSEPAFVKELIYHKYSVMSPNGLADLVRLEWKLYPKVKQIYYKICNLTKGTFRSELENQNRDVLAYISNFEESTRKIVGNLNLHPTALGTAKKVALNPLSMYKILSRFRIFYFPLILECPHGNNPIKSEIARFVRNAYNITDGPSRDDYETTLEIILKFQFMYDLEVKNVAAGLIQGADARVTLNANDCYLIGKHGISKTFFTAGIQWLEHALYLVQNTSDNSISFEVVYDELARAEIQHDEELYAEEVNQYHLFNKPLSQTLNPKDRITKKSILNKELEINKTATTNYDGLLWNVCSGKVTQTIEEKSKLFCWYESEIHISYKIGPVKAELHSISPNPEIVQFYEVLSERAIQAIKQFGQENSKRVIMAKGPLDPYSCEIIRAKDINVIGPESSRGLKLLSRLSRFKASRISSDVPLYHYGHAPGTYRGRHYDYKGSEEINFISTALFYLNDVESGGETAFHRIGLLITPKKGSALYWFNYYSCGTLNALSEHASCPIILGEKWIFSRDFFESEQNHLKCHLKPQTGYEVVVKGKPRFY